MEYIAHIDNNNEKQSVAEHCQNTAALCCQFSIAPLKNICYYIGLMHDIGKYQNTFQRRINGEEIKVEHSICGAKEAYKVFLLDKNLSGFLAALCIMGHHGGLPDCGDRIDSEDCSTLFGRIKRATDDYSAYRIELGEQELPKQEIENLLNSSEKSKEEMIERFAFLVRYCYSCLVDADTIDTKTFCTQKKSQHLTSDLFTCKDLLDYALEAFSKTENQTQVQKARTILQRQAFENIKRDSEIYLMNMPTGSGKTLASMKCALYRAAKSKKKIIYIIPYNSIIDQTVEVFDNLFGDKANILRHQSTFSYEESDCTEEYKTIAMSVSENWDADIIITTAVQFFESVYSNKRSKLRKLHNMGDSILVFDEAHLMPTEYLQACLRAVAYLTKFCNSEALFLTATMPDFGNLIKRYALKSSVVTDLVPDKTQFDIFKNNRYIYWGTKKDEEIISKAMEYSSSLLVVNSRNKAKKLYVKASGKKFHLSTYMAGADRERTIRMIKEALNVIAEKRENSEVICDDDRVLVISTSLIEAGVDLDFESAFRELNGLDNILQTGGRCNREGKYEKGDVYIFEFVDNSRPLTIQQAIVKGILTEYNDISSIQAIRCYYNRLLELKKEDIIKNSLGSQCSSPYAIPFRSYSVNIIEAKTESVIIPEKGNKNCTEQIARLKNTGTTNMRLLQNHCAAVYRHELDTLLKQNAVKEYGGLYVLENIDYYDSDTGILLEGKDIYI